MAFSRGPTRPSSSGRSRGPVFAVGGRVYVARVADGQARVTLTDDLGKTAVATLDDGTEVTVLGWRPTGAGGARYEVRVTATGVEGWLGVSNLRGTPKAPPPPASQPAPSATNPAPVRNDFGDTARRFGQKR